MPHLTLPELFAEHGIAPTSLLVERDWYSLTVTLLGRDEDGYPRWERTYQCDCCCSELPVKAHYSEFGGQPFSYSAQGSMVTVHHAGGHRFFMLCDACADAAEEWTPSPEVSRQSELALLDAELDAFAELAGRYLTPELESRLRHIRGRVVAMMGGV